MSNTNSWKYEIGDIVCAPRQSADQIWGVLFVMERIQLTSVSYYECWSQKSNRVITMPKKTLEEGWYVPKEKDKEATREF